MDRLHPTVKRLMTARGLRSLGQGMMIVDLALYLNALHWSGVAIGMVLTAGALLSSVLILIVGVLSDRIGRKPFLILGEILSLVSAVGACVTANPLFLTLAIVIASFGRGQTGSSGPFAPAEQAWLARLVPAEDRGRVYSWNNAIGFFGMGIGAALGGAPHVFQGILPGALSYRPIFAFLVVISVACLVIILRLPEEKQAKEESNEDTKNQPINRSTQNQTEMKANTHSHKVRREGLIRRKENKQMIKLSFVNIINGLAIGLTGPLISYWFALKFGVGPALVGLTLSLSYLLTGVSSIFNGFLSDRFGMIKSVTVLRLVGAAMLLVLPFCPMFWLASVVYILRNALNRGTQGARAALSASLTRDKRRGLSSSVGAVSMQIPSSIGPSFSGALLDAGFLVTPFLAAAGLQFVYAVLYQAFFRDYDRPKKVKGKVLNIGK